MGTMIEQRMGEVASVSIPLVTMADVDLGHGHSWRAGCAVGYDDNCLMMNRFPDASTGMDATGSTVMCMLGPKKSARPR